MNIQQYLLEDLMGYTIINISLYEANEIVMNNMFFSVRTEHKNGYY